MKSSLPFLLVAGLSNLYTAQEHSGKWTDLFSYNQIISIKQDQQNIIAATNSGLFYYNPTSGEIKKHSKANGLHNIGITAFDYNPETQTGLIGYESGAIDLISPEGTFLSVDIPIAGSYQGSKKINHIYIKGHQAVVSTNYGVSVFNLEKREFAETAFFQSGGQFVPALESFIKDNTIYTATSEGIKSHLIDIKFPIYTDWHSTPSTPIYQVDFYENTSVWAGKTKVYLAESLQPLSFNFSNIKDIVAHREYFLVFDEDKIYQISYTGDLVNSFETPTEQLSTGLLFNQNELYAGTELNGILKIDQWGSHYPHLQNGYIKPDGPFKNTATRLTLLEDKIWVAPGRKTSYYISNYQDNLGYYYYNGQEWIYPDYFKDNPNKFNILDIAVNPTNPNEIYFTNYVQLNAKGVYKMLDNELEHIFNLGGTRYYNIPEYLAFDEKNNLYSSFALYQPNKLHIGIFMIPPKAKQGNIIKTINAKENTSCILSEGPRLFIGAPRDGNNGGGLIVFDNHNTPDNTNDDFSTIIKEELPTPLGVTALALDQQGVLWIGNKKGLRILNNPMGNPTDLEPQIITIVQNGIPEELFKDSDILSIAVDSGNNKWISVNGGGVYFISADGQKVFQHFTQSNSPLPTNEVTDIKINHKTGKVYFATNKGIVAYQSDISLVGKDFGNVLIYPNPVIYKQYKGNVKIKGLAEKTHIRITDSAGNLLHQAITQNGFYEWDLRNDKGLKVASGVYFVLMTNEDGTDTATAKIAVIN